ncbi:50S ribosomal protein L5 [Candidatus Daviesbacteria bacterium]|nr:50S ribosomal protein L5 [Candidatus Daviesbacteria bacterium]
MNTLKNQYITEIRGKLQQEFAVKNVMAVPRLEKIVISMGLGEAKDNAGILDKVRVYLSALAGQSPVVARAKKSIANFKLSQGQPIGMKVTLRGKRMYAFFEKLVNVVLPKVRDFKGISDTAFDGQGNLNIGLKEQIIFPEVDYRTVDKTRGLAITVVTTATSKDQGKKLLEYLGMPFKKDTK